MQLSISPSKNIETTEECYPCAHLKNLASHGCPGKHSSTAPRLEARSGECILIRHAHPVTPPSCQRPHPRRPSEIKSYLSKTLLRHERIPRGKAETLTPLPHHHDHHLHNLKCRHTTLATPSCNAWSDTCVMVKAVNVRRGFKGWTTDLMATTKFVTPLPDFLLLPRAEPTRLHGDGVMVKRLRSISDGREVGAPDKSKGLEDRVYSVGKAQRLYSASTPVISLSRSECIGHPLIVRRRRRFEIGEPDPEIKRCESPSLHCDGGAGFIRLPELVVPADQTSRLSFSSVKPPLDNPTLLLAPHFLTPLPHLL